MDSSVPSLLMQAAQSAAHADGVVPPQASSGGINSAQLMQQAQLLQQQQQQQQQKAKAAAAAGGGKKKGPPLRRGKWTPEEEAYANRLIQEFKAGLLPLTDGTTLRTFLSKLLNCDPMRISKKFVGSNCIGKQVFRRRTADLNRLTPEQIQKSRAELSELERRFLERVAQTNRVKSSGVGGAGPPAGAGPAGTDGIKKEDLDSMINPPSPPWLQPPLGYKQGGGAAMAAANLVGGGGNSRAAAAGRALLDGFGSGGRKNGSSMGGMAGMGGMNSPDSAGLLAMAELQRRASQQSLLQSMRGNSAQNFLAAAGSQGSSMAQMARNASAARMAGLGGGNSINNLMKGLSRDQLSQLAREGGLSSASLSNMIERKNSFDALMGIDIQSLQSIDNLANLIQNGGNASNNVPSSGMKNWSAEPTRNGSSGSLTNAARRLASAGNMESLLRSLSGNNVKNANSFLNNNTDNSGTSNANLQNLLQNMQNGNSMNSLLGGSGNAASAVSLANLLRENSSTGLSALRMQDGLNERNNSVEDFLSLVAAGDIPHQDPSLLNVPIMQHQQNNGQGGNNNSNAAMLAQQQLLAQATGNPALANALASRSFGNLARNTSGNLSGLGNSGSAAALLAQAAGEQGSSMSLKRKLLEMEGAMSDQGGNKR